MRSSTLAAWLLPDLAFAAAAGTFFYAIVLLPGYQKLLLDSDAGWHIRAGERILREHALPRVDPFSFTMRGASWFAWEWGADTIVGIIHKYWSLSGVVYFYAAAIAAGVWLWFRLNWAVGGNFLLACLFAAPMISSTTLHWLARPHLLSWLFLLGAVWFAETLRRDARITVCRAAAVIAVSVLWTNIHGSFFMGPLIGFIYALGILAANLIGAGPATPWQPHAIYAALAAAASLANPYGWNLHLHVFSYLADSKLLAMIHEFQSFNFHEGGGSQVLIVLALAAIGGALALIDRDVPAFLLTFLLIAAGLRSARGLPIVALLSLPLANGAITKSLARWQGLKPAVRHGIDAFLSYCQRLRAFDARANGMAWAPVLALLAALFLRLPAIHAQTGFPASEFPVNAAPALERMPEETRLLSNDKFGGYLIYRFDGRRKVFFDGRSDLYGANFLKRVGRLMQLRPGWQQILDSYRFDAALLPPDYPLVPALEQAGWQPLYQDSVSILLKRN